MYKNVKIHEKYFQFSKRNNLYQRFNAFSVRINNIKISTNYGMNHYISMKYLLQKKKKKE